MNSLWVFLAQHGVDPTNNRAKQAWRFGVLWRKRSQGTESAKGNRATCHSEIALGKRGSDLNGIKYSAMGRGSTYKSSTGSQESFTRNKKVMLR